MWRRYMWFSLNTTMGIIALVAAALAAYFTWQGDLRDRIQNLEVNADRVQRELEQHSHGMMDAMITQCRICFKETEGSSQCQETRESCSAWSGRNDVNGVVVGNWTKPFRDDTDHRPGGCNYQWMVQCK